MFIRNQLNYIFGSVFLAVVLLFSGCNSGGYNSSTGGNQNEGPSFNSGDVAPGEAYNYTFEETGSVDYYCQVHTPDMQGQITVTASADSVERDTVIMNNLQFQPSNLSVAPGTEVVWINNDGVNHRIVNGNPSSGDDDDDGGY